jgi:hypothetical protein
MGESKSFGPEFALFASIRGQQGFGLGRVPADC